MVSMTTDAQKFRSMDRKESMLCSTLAHEHCSWGFCLCDCHLSRLSHRDDQLTTLLNEAWQSGLHEKIPYEGRGGEWGWTDVIYTYYDLHDKKASYQERKIVTEVGWEIIQGDYWSLKEAKAALRQARHDAAEKIRASEEAEIGTHVTHCCKDHGCKYGDDDCPVKAGTHKQEFPCEMCGEDDEPVKDVYHDDDWGL